MKTQDILNRIANGKHFWRVKVNQKLNKDFATRKEARNHKRKLIGDGSLKLKERVRIYKVSASLSECLDYHS